MNGSIGLLELTEKKSILTTIEAQPKETTKKKSKKDKAKNTYNICIQMREDNYIMAGLRGAVYYQNFFVNKPLTLTLFNIHYTKTNPQRSIILSVILLSVRL
jgi:hypothetical protein